MQRKWLCVEKNTNQLVHDARPRARRQTTWLRRREKIFLIFAWKQSYEFNVEDCWSKLKGWADERTMMDDFCSSAASTNTEN